MRVIKLAFISFIILFLLVTGISLFIPSRVRISRAIELVAPADSVSALIRNPLRWKEWFPGTDTAAVYYENGQAKGVVLNRQQDRRLVISESNDSAVVAKYSGISQKGVVTGWNIIPNTGPSVTLQWYMDFSLRWYPWEKFASLLFEKQYGPQMEAGLANLKRLAEER